MLMCLIFKKYQFLDSQNEQILRSDETRKKGKNVMQMECSFSFLFSLNYFTLI